MALAAGTRLGPYEIIDALGAGGMGEVYRARDTRLDRTVAVKVLPDGLSGNVERLQRFEQEARIVSALNHPNLLALHDIGSDRGMAFLVSELLEGQTLRARLRESTLPPRKALEHAVQIANGLAAAHEKGVIHRDLKPDNIFLTRDGRVKILDFGLAKLADHGLAAAAGDNQLTAGPATHPGVVMGTVGYMSPEQVRGKAADHRSDLFSLGTIVYEMLAGQSAFSGESSVEVMNAILKDDPPDIAATKQNIPPAIERVIRRCLEKSPEERFQSARDVAFALEAVSTTSAGSGARAALAEAPVRKWRWLVPAAVVLLLLLLAAGLSFYTGLEKGRAAAGKGVAFRLLNYRTEMIFSALFAPDGKTIVYSAASEGNTPELYTLQGDYPEPRPLGLPGTHLLSISSRGEMALLTKVRYVGHRLFNGTLATMPLGGGAPREVLENVRQAAWAPDGSALAVIREVDGVDRLEYPVGTVLYETAGYVSDPRFSPAGDKIAFLEHPIKYDDRGGVAVVDIASRKHTILTDGYWGEEGLAWSPQGDEIFFAAGTGYASFHVYGVTLAGRLRVALDSAGGLTLQDISPNGRWLASRDDIRNRIMLRTAGERERDLSWLEYSTDPLLSPDGRLIALNEQGTVAGMNYAVCVRRTDGSPVVRLGEGRLLDLSPDAKWVLATVPSSGSVMLYPLGAGELRRLRNIGLGEIFSARFFPDGKSLVLCGNQKGASSSRCYVQSLEDESRFRALTPEGKNEAFVSPDGKRVLAGIPGQGGSYVLYPVDGGAPVPVPGVLAEDGVIDWDRDGSSILLLGRAQIPAPVERLVLASGRREKISDIVPADRTGVLSVGGVTFAADSKTFAYSFLSTVSSLFLVEDAK